MKGLRKGPRRGLPIAIGALAALALVLGTAEAAQAETAKLRVDMSAQRFAVKGDKVIARGPVEAKVTRADGTTDTIRKQVKFQVQPTGRCRILSLHLAPLYLNLLGLEVRTSDINVRIAGRPEGGLLGELFCNLSEGINLNKRTLMRRTARSLNERLAKRELSFVTFKANLQTQQQPQVEQLPLSSSMQGRAIPPVPPGSCEILNLMLGPLHLDLLGLLVDVFGEDRNQPVQVLVTANPAGGLLGELLCSIGGEPTVMRPSS